MTFSQPSAPNTGDKFEAHQHQNSLLLVYPKRFEENIKTTKGLSDAADVDIIVVDKHGPDGRPLAFHGARLFGNLARSVRNDLGGQVLGRLKQIVSANGNTPWILENFTDMDAAAAGPVHAAYQQGQFQPTQNPMAAPAAPPAATWQGASAGVPQQWQGQPAPAVPAPTPVAAPPQQWNPGPAVPAQQQWAPPVATAAPVAATPAAPSGVDPAVLARLAQFGITPPPGTPADQIMAIYQTLPQ